MILSCLLPGVCCASLKDSKALMKMGLALVLVGHVNFLLGALVHGAVLRHIKFQKQARIIEYTVSNVIAIVAGLVVSWLVHGVYFSHSPKKCLTIC